MFMSYELYNFYKHVSFSQKPTQPNLLARSRTHIYFVLSLLLSFFMSASAPHSNWLLDMVLDSDTDTVG